MSRIEWDGGLQIIVYKEHRSLSYYRCLRCQSTRVSEYNMETNFGLRCKLRCHKCKDVYIYIPGSALDNHGEYFEEIQASEVEHIEHKKKGKIVENDDQLAPLEFVDIWAAKEFCRWNRCAICQAELTTKPVEPYDDYIKAHFNVECPEHGLCIKGGTANIKKIVSINMDNTIREVMDRVLENSETKPSKQSNDRMLKELGF